MVNLDSFDQSPLDVFVQSPLDARNGGLAPVEDPDFPTDNGICFAPTADPVFFDVTISGMSSPQTITAPPTPPFNPGGIVVFAGPTDNRSLDVQANGTFVARKQAENICRWEYILFQSYRLYRVLISFSGSDVIVQIYWGAPSGTIGGGIVYLATYSLPLADFDASGGNVMNLIDRVDENTYPSVPQMSTLVIPDTIQVSPSSGT